MLIFRLSVRSGHRGAHQFRTAKTGFGNKTGKYIMMRKASQLEIQAADGSVDLRKLKEEMNFLKGTIEALGFNVLLLPPDEESPFSSRIARYAFADVPGQLNLNVHPDGKSPVAHHQIKNVLQQHKVFLPVKDLFTRKNVFHFDSRDLVRIGGVYIVAQRTEGYGGALEFLNEVIQPKGMKAIGNLGKDKMRTMRAISFAERGLHLPLKKMVTSLDGHSLIVDAAHPNMVTALQQTGITLAGGVFNVAPPHTTECMFLETRSELFQTIPVLLMPMGFPEVESYVQQNCRDVNIVPLAMNEILKMGISLHELLLPITPVVDEFGGMSGSFSHADAFSRLNSKNSNRDFRSKSNRSTGFFNSYGERDPNVAPQMPKKGSTFDKKLEAMRNYHRRTAENREFVAGVESYMPGVSKGPMNAEPEPWVPGAKSPATFTPGWTPPRRGGPIGHL
eukprot:TRINITY_DN17841_c0_g1_i2.p1 TRINITY_DN17841_c0_g1~~TRINITY_DN17841_c0_g1_i2.p1  ORF type:complete len:463 (+),score=63.74 TRINITY_DN17841_c0_g1_i2:47-1390(+)